MRAPRTKGRLDTTHRPYRARAPRLNDTPPLSTLSRPHPPTLPTPWGCFYVVCQAAVGSFVAGWGL